MTHLVKEVLNLEQNELFKFTIFAILNFLNQNIPQKNFLDLELSFVFVKKSSILSFK